MDATNVGNHEIRRPQSVTQILGAESSSDEIEDLPAISLSTAIEYAQTAINEMHMKLTNKDVGVLSSLKKILVALMRVVEIAKGVANVELELGGLKATIKAVEIISSVPTAGHGKEYDRFQDHSRAVTEIVQKLLSSIGDIAALDRQGQPIAQQIEIVENLLEILQGFLGVYQFEDDVAVNERLGTIHRALADGKYALRVLNSNSNTTYNFGHDVVNNNWVKVFVTPCGTDYMTPRLAQTQEKTTKIIRQALGSRFVHDAAHDTQPDEAGCMPGTRLTVLSMFMEWVKIDPKRLFWLAGLAGTGKTSIAVTLCRDLHADATVVLGGAFFCSRTANSIERTDARCILPTLAAALAEQSPGFAAELAKELKLDPRAPVKPITVQIGCLIRRPLAALASSLRPIVFVIDALDECTDEIEVEKLLRAITELDCGATIKFILTSRPETHISSSFISKSDRNDILRLHTIDTAEVTGDIQRYIHTEFSQQQLGTTWYTDENIKDLATRAGGLFIFASTIVRYVVKGMAANARRRRLQNVLLAVNTVAATLPLDAMYGFVLTRASSAVNVDPEELDLTRQGLACILTARMPLSVGALADLLGREKDDLLGALGRLQSVIHVPDQPDQPGLRTLHASFGDYLLHRAADDIRISASHGHNILAAACLDVMNRQLHINISQHRSSYKPNPSSKTGSIPLSVEYACLQWIFHVIARSDSWEFDGAVGAVFKPKFMFWLEVMSALGRLRRAIAMLVFAAATARSSEHSRFLRDAVSFVTSSRAAIEHSTAHIYLSALPFAAKDSSIFKFASHFTGLNAVSVTGLARHGGHHVMTLVGHEGGVTSVSYSPDGLSIASGSRDGTIRIWDMRTGEEKITPLRSDDGSILAVAFCPNGRIVGSGTEGSAVCIWAQVTELPTLYRLRGHSGAVQSVAFTPDGLLFASASRDMTVRLWSIETREVLAVLDGHTDWINAVSFSPNGRILLSGSDDEIIRTWHSDKFTDRATGGTLRDHFFPCFSLSHSPDGSKVASGSLHCVRLWEPETGRFIGELRGHSGDVRSVQFSPDGQSLVTGADDMAVRIWDFRSGVPNVERVALVGHTAEVCSTAFSPDGLYIASASEDCTVKIWDTGIIQSTVLPLTSMHDGRVNSVAVSPDDKIIISGSVDGSLRAWDAMTAQPKLSPLLGHRHAVTSVAISPNGQLVASGSLDNTIRLWRAQSGAQIGAPLRGHADGVQMIAFSPNARWLVSGSLDETVRIWDIGETRPSHRDPIHCSREVNSVLFSRDSLQVLAGDSGGRVYCWKTNSGDQLFEPMQVAESSIRCIALAPNGMHVASGGSDIKCSVWDLNSRRHVRLLEGHSKSVNSIAYSPDGRYIVTSSEDQTVRLWSTETGTSVAILKGHTGTVRSAVFTTNGRSIVSGSADGTLRVWNMSAAQLLNSADSISWLLPSSDSTTHDPINAVLRDGWLTGPSGELLMWVPEEYRSYLPMAPCTMHIKSPSINIHACSSTLYHGDSWTKCWNASVSGPE